MDVAQSSSEIKGRFNIAAPAAVPAPSNPLQRAGTVEETVRRLFDAQGNRQLGPPDAVRDSFHDVKTHNQAMIAAMQIALKQFLARPAPGELKEFASTARSSARQRRPAAANPAKYWESVQRDVTDADPTNPRTSRTWHICFTEEFARPTRKIGKLPRAADRSGQLVSVVHSASTSPSL